MSAGTISVCADEAGRFTQFAISMQGLEAPSGTRTLWQIGNDISRNRNQAAAAMDGDWLWFIDDDHVFPPDTLLNLIALDLDVVAPLYLRRQQPFESVAWRDGKPLDLGTLPEHGAVEVDATGTAGMLVRRHVFEALDEPFFWQTEVSEDLNFCSKVRAAGFPIHIDTDTKIGHITTAAIWPMFDGGEWRTGLSVADGLRLQIPRA